MRQVVDGGAAYIHAHVLRIRRHKKLIPACLAVMEKNVGRRAGHDRPVLLGFTPGRKSADSSLPHHFWGYLNENVSVNGLHQAGTPVSLSTWRRKPFDSGEVNV
jgi:hypothetical protein